MEALGRLFDLSAGIPVGDLHGQANTGNRVHLKNAASCTIVLYKAAGTAAQDPVLDVQQHTAASGGSTADLDVVTHYYHKSETTLDGDETWTTIGVGENIIEASWRALEDSLVYGLLRAELRS